jgi:hypothetical protein
LINSHLQNSGTPKTQDRLNNIIQQFRNKRKYYAAGVTSKKFSAQNAAINGNPAATNLSFSDLSGLNHMIYPNSFLTPEVLANPLDPKNREILANAKNIINRKMAHGGGCAGDIYCDFPDLQGCQSNTTDGTGNGACSGEYTLDLTQGTQDQPGNKGFTEQDLKYLQNLELLNEHRKLSTMQESKFKKRPDGKPVTLKTLDNMNHFRGSYNDKQLQSQQHRDDMAELENIIRNYESGFREEPINLAVNGHRDSHQLNVNGHTGGPPAMAPQIKHKEPRKEAFMSPTLTQQGQCGVSGKNKQNDQVSNSCKRDNRGANYYIRSNIEKDSVLNELNQLHAHISSSGAGGQGGAEKPGPKAINLDPRRSGIQKNSSLEFNNTNDHPLSVAVPNSHPTSIQSHIPQTNPRSLNLAANITNSNVVLMPNKNPKPPQLTKKPSLTPSNKNSPVKDPIFADWREGILDMDPKKLPFDLSPNIARAIKNKISSHNEITLNTNSTNTIHPNKKGHSFTRRDGVGPNDSPGLKKPKTQNNFVFQKVGYWTESKKIKAELGQQKRTHNFSGESL